jgi:2,3-bisphosphoglycerate-independent phosphoglycerate mutase
VKEHRFVVVFRADGLGDAVNDTDPQAVGVAPLLAAGKDPASQKTAAIVNLFVTEVGKVLAGDAPTNGITMRGFARYPQIGTMEQVYGLKSAAIAVYPMYKGLARLVGMDVLDAGQTLQDQLNTLESVWEKYDFFFLHYKYTDSTGEDGNFPAKVQMIEKLDAAIPGILKNKPDVFVVTGDHSTPSKMKSHSWHPVPTLILADTCRPDGVTAFNESACVFGGLGHFQAMHLMLLVMAHAGRLGKYGA